MAVHPLFAGVDDAVHVAAGIFVLQVSTVDCPEFTVVGFAVSVTVGGWVTFTVTDALPLTPPGPPQSKLNVVVAARLLMVC